METSSERLRAAIYLVGHGRKRQPRLLDLQLRRILRYRELRLLAEPKEDWETTVFADLNWPQATYPNFPELARLAKAVEEGCYQLVYTDVQETDTTFGSEPYAFVRRTLERSGACVINVFYDPDEIFDRELKKEYGETATITSIDDESDLVCFFPGLAARIVETALRDELPRDAVERGGALAEIKRRIETLADSSPYVSGRIPFIEDALERKWQQNRSERQEARNNERRKKESVYQLGPHHDGYLWDEHIHPSTDVRSPDQFPWAENRLRELAFRKRKRGQVISYRRMLEGYTVFADVRQAGRIDFYVYDPHETPIESLPIFKHFSLQDSWRKDLEAKWLRQFHDYIRRR